VEGGWEWWKVKVDERVKVSRKASGVNVWSLLCWRSYLTFRGWMVRL